MLDPSIPLMAKGIDSLQMLDDGSKLAQLWQSQKTDAEMNRLYKESSGDLDKMLEIGKQSPMARYVMPQLQAQKTAQQKSLLDQQKIEADIGKTKSETQKNTIQTRGYGVENSVKLLENANRALKVAAQTGDVNAAKMALNNAYKAGTITPELYDQYNQQIDSLSTKPEELMQFAQGIILSGEENAMKYIQPDQNAMISAETTRRGQDIDRTIAENRLNFDYEKTDAENQYKYDALGQDESQFWADYNQKDAQFYSNQDFQLMKTRIEKQQVKGETPEQKMTRIDNAIGSADAARQAARAAVDAAALIKHPGIASGTGLTSFTGMIPSTDAKDFQARLENLKSQVFLPTVKSLQGMGALSNAEGEKIASAVANLDPSIGQEALTKQLTILAQEMSNSAKKAQRQTQNYATRGGTIKLQTQSQSNNQSGGKVYTQAMIREYAQQSGRSVQEVAKVVRDSGGTIQ